MNRTGNLFRKAAVLAALLCALLLISAAAQAADIGISMPTASLQRWVSDAARMRSELEAVGYTVDVRYADNDAGLQDTQIEDMVVNGAHVLIVTPVNGGALDSVLSWATGMGIKVIAYDRLLTNTSGVSYYVTFSNFNVGKLQGTYIKSMLQLDSEPGPFNIEFTAGDPNDSNAAVFFNGAMSVLKPYIDSGKLVVRSGQKNFSQVTTNAWSSSTAQSRAASILASYYADGSTLDAWMCSNDSTALGVIRALEASGYRNKWPVITGQDADLINAKYIIVGKQAMSVLKQTSTLASRAARMAKQILQGSQVETNTTEYNHTINVPTYYCSPVYVTKGNYKELLIDTGIYTESQLLTDLPSPPPEPEAGVVINSQNFPDDAFRTYISRFDLNASGVLTQEELNAVVQISVDGSGIKTLKGIEYFTALKELTCWNNALTSLDVSSNSALTFLNCGNNQLTWLDLSANTALETVYCQNNKLAMLDVSRSAGLRLLCCPGNQLTTLNPGANPALTTLYCSDNQLASLDVSRNTALEIFYCAGNQLTAVDVGANTALKWLDCSRNQLAELDVSRNSALEWLACYSNKLIYLNVSQCPVLAKLVKGQSPQTENNRKIWATPVDAYNEYRLETDLNVTVSADGETGVVLNVQNFPDDGFRNYLSRFDLNGNGLLSTDELEKVLDMDVRSRNITSLKGIEYFTALRTLQCGSNALTELDLSKNTCLTELNCSGNYLTALDLRNNPELMYVGCGQNRLTSLELAGNSKLVDLACSGNQLTTLDLSGQTRLETVSCYDNQLTSLNLDGDTALYGLAAYGNKLTKLEIIDCPVLVKLVSEVQPKEATFVSWTRTEGEMTTAWLYADKGVEVVTENKAEELITAFVTRCYQLILGRNPDPHGLETWYTNLNSGQKAAAEIIDSFVRSVEFKGKNYSNADAVEILYKTMLGRGSDPAGKAGWVAKLDAGQPLAAVINGFCGSNEFKAICASYGIRPGSVDVPEEVPTTPDEKIKAFVRRCYKIILGRGADEVGLNSWFNALKSRQRAASEIIDGFVRSVEFMGKGYTNEEAVEILYKAMLGRGSDPKGKANWVAKLNAGQPLAVVINGFCGSQEFTGLCASYGIEPGRVNIQVAVGQSEEELAGLAYNAEEPITKRSETNPNRVSIINPSDTIDPNIGTAVQAVYINEEKAKEFVSWCYQYILGRNPNSNELANWVAQMTNGTKTADQIARGFLFSDEFKGRNVGNLDLVKILYRVYLNRDADPAGLASWTAKLDSGMGLKDLLDSLVKTSEYKNVISEMGK